MLLQLRNSETAGQSLGGVGVMQAPWPRIMEDMRKVCPYCGDRHICLPPTSVRGGTVSPPAVEEVTLFLANFGDRDRHLDRDGIWSHTRTQSSLFYEKYLAICEASDAMPLGRRTFNNALVALGWERRKVNGLYWWVKEVWPTPATAG